MMYLLLQALPEADIDLTTLENESTVRDQAKWFASKHFIIAVHGAALTNSAFITKGTFVLQIYPPGFHWQSLDLLIEQSGGIALDWYEGEYPIENAFLLKINLPEKKNRAQHQNLLCHPKKLLILFWWPWER